MSALETNIVPVVIKDISTDKRDQYYRSFHGAGLKFSLFEEGKDGWNLIARGLGVTWNEQYQQTPVMELNERRCLEIVTGAMPPGQLSIQTVYFMQLNDGLPTSANLASINDIYAMVQVGDNEPSNVKGLVLDVFKGIKIAGRQGNFNATSLYLTSANMMYRDRMTGLEYLSTSNYTKNYPASYTPTTIDTIGATNVPVPTT